MERFTDKDIAKKINTGYYGDSCNSFEIYARCAEFEDLMEEFGFESVEQLKEKIMEDATNADFYKRLGGLCKGRILL